MERKELFAAVIKHAGQMAATEVTSAFERAKETIAAFVVVAHEARFSARMTTKDERQTAIKKEMLRHNMSNGKASAYAKIADHIAMNMVTRYGQPDAAEGQNGFWVAWGEATTAPALCQIAATYLAEHVPGDKIGEIADACGVAYGGTKTEQANSKALAKLRRPKGPAGVARKAAPAAEEAEPEALNREQVFAAFLALSGEDQAWFVDRIDAVRAHVARDVSVPAIAA